MERAEAHVAQHDIARIDRAAAEPSMLSALERLGAASQGVVAKRIDLALLEGHELLSRTLGSSALVGAGMVLAAAAWFAVAAGFVLLVTPAAPLAVHLAIFGLINGGGAVGLVALGMHCGRSQKLDRPNGSVSSPPAQP